MSPVFTYSSSVQILQHLVNPALLLDNIETVSKAIRCWVLLNFIYGQNQEFDLENFTYQDLIKQFFIDGTNSHKRDAKPTHNDLNCPCGKNSKELLFSGYNNQQMWTAFQEEQWRKLQDEFITYYQNFRNNNLNEYFNNISKVKPFFVTGKTMQNTLNHLVDHGWLIKVKSENNSFQYQKVEVFPEIHLLESDVLGNRGNLTNIYSSEFTFLPDDYTGFANLFSRPIQGKQRFFMHPDYAGTSKKAQQITKLQNQLKEIWEKNPVNPIQLSYHSASLNQDFNCVIYPICIYYYQRGFYLCSFGQIPKPSGLIGWYNYRLERINSIQELHWKHPQIPEQFKDEYEKQCQKYADFNDDNDDFDPFITEIQDSLDEAYGFDFYQKSQEMLLRFPANFYQSYIANTVRHNTFKKIKYQEVRRKILQSSLTNEQKKIMIDRCNNYSKDAFYILKYRENDNSVLMRLRSWSPNVEVILPLDLRQRMKQDIGQTWQLYQDDF